MEAGESGGDGDGGRHPHPIMGVGILTAQKDFGKKVPVAAFSTHALLETQRGHEGGGVCEPLII